ncbi:MAG: SulP family inorganic anion transporter [Planctomycetaceae bacterium]
MQSAASTRSANPSSLPPAPRKPHAPDDVSFGQRLKYYFNPVDGRFEDLARGPWYLNVLRDFTAGLIVAMVAIPLAMGMAMASGLQPEQGIVGGAVAGLVGALFGGSKYQVYGPTAAFIPIIAGIMATGYGHSFLVLCSLFAGGILIVMGLARLGRIVALVPHSIVVGFTIGIAIVIALSQVGEALGLPEALGYKFLDKVQGIWAQAGQISIYAILIALMTFVLTKMLLKISIYIPAPLIALGVGTGLASTIWSDKGLLLIRDKYGAIPTNLLVFTGPSGIELSAGFLFSLVYFVIAIVFVSGVESLLCSRMADRLADNRGMPYNPNKELWGQGWVQTIVPLFNGFPHTGALARTATNIKVGALSPLAGFFKFGLKLLLAVYLATFLEMVPMACIGGILMFVAFGMVKPAEVTQVLAHNRFHVALMIYTAVMVVLTDFLIGVLSAIVLYAVLHRFLDTPVEPPRSPTPATEPEPEPESVPVAAAGYQHERA